MLLIAEFPQHYRMASIFSLTLNSMSSVHLNQLLPPIKINLCFSAIKHGVEKKKYEKVQFNELCTLKFNFDR